MRQQNSNGGRRPRGRTNNRKQHSGGQNRSGTYDSNGPDGRIRGNASQVYEKYIGLARDATSASDRIAAEAYYQHAEHYYRIVNDSTDPESPGSQRALNAQSNASQQPSGDVDGNQAVPQQAGQSHGGQSHGGQAGRGHQGRHDRSSQSDRQGQNDRYQERRSRGPARDDAEVPGLEPQPDLAPGAMPVSGPVSGDRVSQSELPLQGQDGNRRPPRGGRSGERGRPRSSDSASDQPRSNQGSGRPQRSHQAESDPAAESSGPSLEDSIPAAIPPIEGVSEEAPAPRRRGRPRKRPVEAAPDAVASDAVATAPDAETSEPAPAPKRRGRPRKVVAEAAATVESEEDV